MELRYNEHVNARILYESILTTFTANLDIISFIVFEYAELALKYFRDIEPKKMLKDYFESYPFHERIFFGLLDFYIKNVELKEGGREGR